MADYKSIGRRKSSTARVTLKNGSGKITVNGQDINDYLPYAVLVQDAEQPLEITNTKGTFDVIVNVQGGGFTGQTGAIRLGITRALMLVNKDYRPDLKAAGMITRDARVKERKKPGLVGARRAPQFSKR